MSTDTFGDRLRAERRDRGLSIQFVAEVLRVDDELPRALERNDFGALPDEAAMADYLHAYAECLEVDADLMIADYDRERASWLRERTPAAAERGAGETPRRLRPALGLGVLLVVGMALLAGWWILSPDQPAPAPKARVSAAQVEPEPPLETMPDIPPADPQPPVAEPPAALPIRAPEAPTESTRVSPAMSISDHGVGTAVENRQLVGHGDRFPEGMEVYFWTRMRRATPGGRIYHVWLRRGVEAARVSLAVGGPGWRTYSSITLYADAAGDWAVEARDDAGRVLARSEFVCIP